MDWISLILTGGLAGWLAGLVMRGGGFGIILNIILGIAGASVGSYIFDYLNVSVADGFLGAVIEAAAGAVVILFIAGLFRGRRR